jgi:hypothetical protein
MGRGISRIWVLGWIDRVEGGKGRWKFRISVSANIDVADMTNIAQTMVAGVIDIRARSIVASRKYEGRERCQLSRLEDLSGRPPLRFGSYYGIGNARDAVCNASRLSMLYNMPTSRLFSQ